MDGHHFWKETMHMKQNKIVQFNSQTKFLNDSKYTTRNLDNCEKNSKEGCGALFSAELSRDPHCAVPRASEGLNPALPTHKDATMFPLLPARSHPPRPWCAESSFLRGSFNKEMRVSFQFVIYRTIIMVGGLTPPWLTDGNV